MGALSQVPFLAGYTEQDQLNRQKEAQGMQALGQFMTLQRQQQEMAQAPEDRLLKRRLIESQIGDHDFKTSQAKLANDREAEKQSLIKMWSEMPDTDPRKPMLQQKLRVLIDPSNALDPSKSDPSMFGKVNPEHYTPASLVKFQQSKNFGDLILAPKPSTNVNVAAPVTPVTIQDPNNPGQSLVIDGRTKNVLGVSPKLGDIPKADLKLSQSLPQAKLRTESLTQNLDKLDAALVSLNDHPGLPYITGTIYGRTPSLRDDAIDAQAQLNSITSQIFQDSLQAMREASKTGGAVGNVSDREGDKLERTMGALDRAQTTESFQNQLKKVRQQIKQSTAIINSAFKDQYDGVEPYRSPNAKNPSQQKGGVLRFDAQGNPI